MQKTSWSLPCNPESTIVTETLHFGRNSFGKQRKVSKELANNHFLKRIHAHSKSGIGNKSAEKLANPSIMSFFSFLRVHFCAMNNLKTNKIKQGLLNP